MKQKRNKMRQSWDFFNEKVCYDTSIKIYQIYQKPPKLLKNKKSYKKPLDFLYAPQYN